MNVYVIPKNAYNQDKRWEVGRIIYLLTRGLTSRSEITSGGGLREEAVRRRKKEPRLTKLKKKKETLSIGGP